MRRRALLGSALALLSVRARAQAVDAGSTVPGGRAPTSAVRPFQAEGQFTNRLDATFGRMQPGATIHSKAELDRIAYYRFIYGDSTTTGDGTDGLYKNYRSRHRDYHDGDPRSLHVITDDALVLRAHCGLESSVRTDCGDGNIESGIVRFALPVRPGSYVEMRCRMPAGAHAWPAFWLNPGQQFAEGPGAKARTSTLTWPPEIDIFDQYGFKGVPAGRALVSGTITNGNDAAYGNPRTTFLDPEWGKNWYYQPKEDLTTGFHTYALDWGRDNTLRFLLDGHMYKASTYEWNSKDGVPAHLIASLQIAPKFSDLNGLLDGGSAWDWPISYIRVWTRG